VCEGVTEQELCVCLASHGSEPRYEARGAGWTCEILVVWFNL